jgi:hypothetical protein
MRPLCFVCILSLAKLESRHPTVENSHDEDFTHALFEDATDGVSTLRSFDSRLLRAECHTGSS